MKTRQIVGAALSAGALLLATACGAATSVQQSGAGGVDQDRVDASSPRVLSAADFSTAIGAAQRQVTSVHVFVRATSGAGTVTAAGDVKVGSTLDDFAIQMKLHIAGHQAELRLVHSELYVSAAMIPGPAGKPWTKIDLSDPSNPFGAVFSQLLSATDPDRVAKLYASITKLKDLGAAQVAGVTTHHYRVTIDSAHALKALGLGKIAGVSVADLLKRMPKTLTSDVWLDAQNRPVRLSYDVAGSKATTQFSHWGESVKVKAPPAGMVHSFTL
jgi:hypothetical protein